MSVASIHTPLPNFEPNSRNTHGTGCSLSSAIAAGLAKGEVMTSAVRTAKTWISAAIAEADRFSVGHGHGPVHHFHKFY